MKTIKKESNIDSTLYGNLPVWGRIPFFAIYAIALFFALKYFFLFYLGLINPVGQFWSPLLAKYSIVQALRYGLIYPAFFVLKLLGYEAIPGIYGIKISGSAGVVIGPHCLGIDIISSFISLIVAYPGKNKLPFAILSLLGVHFINIVRVLCLTILNHYNNKLDEPGHDIFNFCCYTFILLIFYWWVKNYSYDFTKPQRSRSY